MATSLLPISSTSLQYGSSDGGKFPTQAHKVTLLIRYRLPVDAEIFFTHRPFFGVVCSNLGHTVLNESAPLDEKVRQMAFLLNLKGHRSGENPPPVCLHNNFKPPHLVFAVAFVPLADS